MGCTPIVVTFRSLHPGRLVGFWGGVVGHDVTVERSAPALTALPEVGFGLRFVRGSEAKRGRNQMHPDLLPASSHEQSAAVRRALELGAVHLDVGQGPDAGHVVLADPGGNEFCVVE